MRISIFTLLFILISCASKQPEAPVKSRYYIDVDAASSDEVSKLKSFRLTGKESKSLRFQEYAKIVKSLLENSGYTYNEKAPEIEIDLSYSISEKVETEETHVPIYGMNNQAVKDKWGNQVGSVQGVGYQRTHTVKNESIRYTRKVSLAAYSTKTKQMVWEVNTSSSGPSSSLKEAFPYMVLAGTEHIGKSHDKPVEAVIFEDDQRITSLK